MSFFDEDDDEPRTSRSRRAGASASGAVTDRQTLLRRRAIALAAGLLLLILLVFAVRACQSSQRENALRDYNRAVTSIGRESDREVGGEFFRLLGQRGNESPQDLQTSISGFREQAETHIRQAEDLSVPEAMVPAHRSLLTSLQFRRDGLGYIAERVRTALGDQEDAATRASTQIAGQMQSFIASDVLYRARVRPLIREALDEAELNDTVVGESQFIDSVAWLNPATVAQRLRGGDAGGTATREPASGTHGTGLDSVRVGDLRLDPDNPSANRIPLGGDITFTVAFVNQGENVETDVRVTLVVESSDGSGQPIRLSRTVDSIAPEATAQVPLQLTRAPPTGAPVEIRVQVAPVPGERTAENNRATYEAAFVAP